MLHLYVRHLSCLRLKELSPLELLLQNSQLSDSEMCHPRCVYKLIGGSIQSITQQVYLMMFITG